MPVPGGLVGPVGMKVSWLSRTISTQQIRCAVHLVIASWVAIINWTLEGWTSA